MQDCIISIANALEILQSCTKPSKCGSQVLVQNCLITIANETISSDLLTYHNVHELDWNHTSAASMMLLASARFRPSADTVWHIYEIFVFLFRLAWVEKSENWASGATGLSQLWTNILEGEGISMKCGRSPKCLLDIVVPTPIQVRQVTWRMGTRKWNLLVPCVQLGCRNLT